MANRDYYYEVLGLKPGASLAEVKQAYRKLAKERHPDRFTHDPERQEQAEAEIKRLNEAYQHLREQLADTEDDLPVVETPPESVTYSKTHLSKEERAERLYEDAAQAAKQGNYQEAIDNLTLAIRLCPTYAEAYRYRGFIYSVMGMELGAEADLKKAKELGLDSKKAGTGSPSKTSSQPPPAQFSWFCTRTLQEHQAAISAIALSRSGKMLASGGQDGEILLWNLQTGNCIGGLKSHQAAVRMLSISANGQLLASGDSDGRIRLWHLTSGSLLRSLSDTNSVLGAAFGADRQTLLTVNSQGILRWWNIQDGQTLRTFVGHSFDVGVSAAFVDGPMLVSGSSDRNVIVWNADGGVLQRSFNTTGAMTAIALSLVDRRLAVAETNGDIKLWNTQSGRMERTLGGNPSRVRTLAFSPNGHLLAAGGDDGVVRLWALNRGELTETLLGHRGAIAGVVFSPDGYAIVSASVDKTIKIWRCD